MNFGPLTRVGEPAFHLLVASASEAWDALRGLERAHAGLVVRFVRGRKATTPSAFFDEAAAALQFPYYFGENWDACHDCLNDLEWLRASAVVICVTDAVRLLEAAPAETARLAAVLAAAARNWHKAGKPFHVALHAASAIEEGSLHGRWRGLATGLASLH
jgi:hypothetical protein